MTGGKDEMVRKRKSEGEKESRGKNQLFVFNLEKKCGGMGCEGVADFSPLPTFCVSRLSSRREPSTPLVLSQFFGQNEAALKVWMTPYGMTNGAYTETGSFLRNDKIGNSKPSKSAT